MTTPHNSKTGNGGGRKWKLQKQNSGQNEISIS